jgi:hypothetical protein
MIKRNWDNIDRAAEAEGRAIRRANAVLCYSPTKSRKGRAPAKRAPAKPRPAAKPRKKRETVSFLSTPVHNSTPSR